jgi:RNA polymerase sigma-70 factor (ECF subfamily)
MTIPDIQHQKAEFARYLAENQARLYGFIHSLVPDVAHADDIYQQTALILWNKFDQFDRSRSFFAWACGIARLEVANFVRARDRQRLYFSSDLNLLLVEAYEEMTDRELEDRRDALSHCVSRLRPADRQLLTECYIEPGGVRAAADRRSRSTHSVYNSLRRIRQTLLACIERTLARNQGAH